MPAPRLLVLDIETSPAIVYAWGLFDQNVGITQVIKPTEVICFAAQFVGERKMHFHSVHTDGKDVMVEAIWHLVDEADAVVHYNGTSFDMKHLNREFLEMGLLPPSPVQQIDLYQTVKSKFRFLSNKMDWVVQRLELGRKTAHEGFGLWKACLDGDDAAWKRMERYNKQDVRLTVALYDELLPWISNHPSVNLFTGVAHSCPKCGSTELEKRGIKRTAVSAFQQWRCLSCGSYSRSGKRIDAVDLRRV